MKLKTYRLAIVGILLLAILGFSIGQDLATPKHNYVPKEGYVPNKETAEAIARAVLIPIYGADKVKSEEPFVAERHDQEWTVKGSMPKVALDDHHSGEIIRHAGGVALVRISVKTGAILQVTHGK